MKEVNRPGLATVAGIGVAGLGIGWLVGLSTSPVVAAVIATLLAAVAALAGGQSASTESKLPLSVSAPPLIALVIGIAVGATLGMNYRDGSLLSHPATVSAKEPLEKTVERWVALGMEKKEVVRRLLDRELPAQRDRAAATEEAKVKVPSGLVANEGFENICAELSRVQTANILSTMAASNDAQLRSLAEESIKLKASASYAEKLRSLLCSGL